MADLSTNTSLVTALNEIEKKVIQAEKDRNNLEINLVDKKVEVVPGSKMSTLIGKVGEIKLGKKWASGTTNSYYDSKHRLKVKGLGFKPSIIFYSYKDSGSNLIRGFYSSFISSNYAYGIYGSHLDSSTDFTISGDEFTIALYYRDSSSSAKYAVSWVAYE